MEFQIHRRTGRKNERGLGSWAIFVPGGACVLLGILILFKPEILVALVAGALIVLGIVLLSIAWRFRTGGSGQLFTMFKDRIPR